MTLIRLKKLDTAFIIREDESFEVIIHPDATISIERINDVIKALEKIKEGKKDEI